MERLAVIQPPLRNNLNTAPATENTQNPFQTAAYVGFGVGALGLVVGSITGILSLSKASSARSQCEGNQCPLDAKEDADASKSLAIASNVSFVAGGLAAAIGLTSLLMFGGQTEHNSKPTGSRIDVTPTRGGGAGMFTARF